MFRGATVGGAVNQPHVLQYLTFQTFNYLPRLDKKSRNLSQNLLAASDIKIVNFRLQLSEEVHTVMKD